MASYPNFPEDYREDAGTLDSLHALNDRIAGLWGTERTTATTAPPAPTTSPLIALQRSFHYEAAPDAVVANCAQEIFSELQREAHGLLSSRLTAPVVERCILGRVDMVDALSRILSSKIKYVDLPGAEADLDVRAELAEQEEALAACISRVLRYPHVLRAVVADLFKVLDVDPAASGLLQPFLFYKGFHALTVHRVAHALWTDADPDGTCSREASQGCALMLQARVSELFAVDIHPGAVVGNGVMFDHATGITIGETAIVGSDVYILHGVTLGATGTPVPCGTKRHPTVGSRTVLGAGSSVLGDVRVGSECMVGAAAIVTKEVEDLTTVVGANKMVGKRKGPDAGWAFYI